MSMVSPTMQAKLAGNLTRSSLDANIDALALHLLQIEPGQGACLQIDCSAVERVDDSGLRFLYVWLQCVKLMGIRPLLVNVPRSLTAALRPVQLLPTP
jgi:ABC-type transporter Mla MlaB component